MVYTFREGIHERREMVTDLERLIALSLEFGGDYAALDAVLEAGR